jgi:hypothetical protein
MMIWDLYTRKNSKIMAVLAEEVGSRGKRKKQIKRR